MAAFPFVFSHIAKIPSTVSEKSDELAVCELSAVIAEEHLDLTAQSSSAPTTESDSIIVHKPEEMILQMHLQQNQSVDTTQNLHHLPKTLNLHQSVMDQQTPLVVLQETYSQNMSKEFEQPHSEAIGHEKHVQQHIHSEREQDSKSI